MLRSVSEVCRHRGVSRTRFYEYKRRFQTHGIDGLKDLPPIAKYHPMTTPDHVVEKVLELALEHPYGAGRAEQLCAQLQSPAPTLTEPRPPGGWWRNLSSGQDSPPNILARRVSTEVSWTPKVREISLISSGES